MTGVVKIEKAFFRPLADGVKKWVFKRPVDLTMRADERWAVTGPRKSDLLRILAAKEIAEPPLSRSYPFLGKDYWPSQVTTLLEFSSSIKASHLSARYESLREDFDESLNEYLLRANGDQNEVDRVLDTFMLKGIQDRWVVGLSNGQNRRARLAQCLLKHPKLLLVDDPFLGLDPPSRQKVSSVLQSLPPNPHVVLGMRIQDEFPTWITHVAVTDQDGVAHQGPIEQMRPHVDRLVAESLAIAERHREQRSVAASKPPGDVIIELDDVSVSYKGQHVFKNLSFQARRGEKWHLQGPNGSGKSTLLALLTADHPQSWNSKIKLFGEPRETGKQSYFGINNNIGHCSPEIHAIFPTRLTVHQAIATGFVTGSFIPPKDLDEPQKARINELITNFDLPADTPLNDLSLSDQKTALFLRAVAKKPEILILDEAFSAMDELRIAECKDLIANYDGTVIVVGHIQHEVADCNKYIRLTGDGNGAQIGDI
jgi:ABC-type molybdenum transport system ATPase subunit/photorepair protein PhrA